MSILHLAAAGLICHAPANLSAPMDVVVEHNDGTTLSEYGVYLRPGETGTIPAEYLGCTGFAEFWDDSVPDINLTIGGCHDMDMDGDDGTDADIEWFVTLWGDSDQDADWDGNGVVNEADLTAFFGGL